MTSLIADWRHTRGRRRDALVLGVLLLNGPQSGWQLSKMTGLGAVALYTVLDRLEGQDCVTETWGAGHQVYAITQGLRRRGCPTCDARTHAGMNAGRNIIDDGGGRRWCDDEWHDD